ncbi:BgTH12-06074 [Blumeria graminis f. sp. triticale]|uniref:BgTH12-06074 n=1 Tax=Blumeria graminis f. sp. triticale TaxID=1689686 RepID=A0A9W4D546_BLUGR|nr:BgTH12-06074 [Blumeria graminis f. sp. triticale]
MLNPSALLSTSIALLIHTSVLASTPVLQTREIEAEEFDYNCQNFIILRKDVNSHVKDACTALKFSPEFNTFPAYFEESYLFPAYNDRVLFSWPVYLGTKRFQPGSTGNYRLVLTHLCELVGLVVVKPSKLIAGQRTVSLCPHVSKAASQPGPISDFSETEDELDRIRCGDQVMFTRKFIIDATYQLCRRKATFRKSNWKPAPRRLFGSDQFWISPLLAMCKVFNKGLRSDIFTVVDEDCKLKGFLYSKGVNLHHCTEAKITKTYQYDPDDHLDHQEIDDYEGHPLKKTDTFRCYNILLGNEMIIKNLKAASKKRKKNGAYENKSEDDEEDEMEKDFPHPKQTLEGDIWLWPLRFPETSIPGVGKRKHEVYFMLGLNSSNKLTGVYFSFTRVNRKRKFKRCLGRHETKNGSHRDVSLGPNHNSPIGG